MNTNFVNLTHHTIELNGTTIPKDPGGPAIVITDQYKMGGRTIKVTGQVTGLPKPQDGTIYIVTDTVLQEVPNRFDVACPWDPVRDAGGHIIGYRDLLYNGTSDGITIKREEYVCKVMQQRGNYCLKLAETWWLRNDLNPREFTDEVVLWSPCGKEVPLGRHPLSSIPSVQEVAQAWPQMSNFVLDLADKIDRTFQDNLDEAYALAEYELWVQAHQSQEDTNT